MPPAAAASTALQKPEDFGHGKRGCDGPDERSADCLSGQQHYPAAIELAGAEHTLVCRAIVGLFVSLSARQIWAAGLDAGSVCSSKAQSHGARVPVRPRQRSQIRPGRAPVVRGCYRARTARPRAHRKGV